MSLSMVLTIKHDGESLLCVGEEEKEGWGLIDLGVDKSVVSVT